MGENESPQPVIKVRRERWKDGHYYSVARNEKGHTLAREPWHNKETTVEVDRRAIYNIGRRKAVEPETFIRRIISHRNGTISLLENPSVHYMNGIL